MKSRPIPTIFLLLIIFNTTLPQTIEELGKIAGRVFDERNEGIPGVDITLIDTPIKAKSNIGGYFCLINIPEGYYTISATIVGFNKATAESLQVTANLISVQDLPLVSDAIMAKDTVFRAKEHFLANYPTCDTPEPVSGYGRIAGQLLDGNNEPIPQACIFLGDNLGGAIASITDLTGHYCIRDVFPGAYDINACNMGYATVTAQGILVIADSLSIQDFKMTKKGRQSEIIKVKAQRKTDAYYLSCDNLAIIEGFGKIAGQVLDEKGRPISGCSVFLEGTDLGTITVGPGYYCQDYIPPGIYNISAMTVGFNKLTAESLMVVEDSISIQDFLLTSDSLSAQNARIRAQKNFAATHPGCD